MNISSLIEEIEKSNLQIHLNKNDDLVIGNIRGHEHLVHKIKANKSSIVSFFKTERVRQFKEIKVISSEEAYYDLSHSQRRLWLIDQFGNTGVAYNISVVYDFAGINQEYFQRALINLISRHESLRTRFVQNKGNVRQVIEDTLDFSQVYSYIDLSAQPSSDLSSIMTEYVSQPFDLSKGPLIRCRLLKLDSDSYKVVLVLHHIISDGWSMNILERDFGLIYNSYLSGEVLDLPKLRIQYKDYAHWQNNEISQGGLVTDRSYWLTRLSGELPTLNLPTDYSRPSEMSYKGSTLRGLIPKESVVLLENLSHSYGGTLFMGLTTVLFGLLYRYSSSR
ncbi:MAG: condensation domain-containing protein, partial [Bacteroidota bacterium]